MARILSVIAISLIISNVGICEMPTTPDLQHMRYVVPMVRSYFMPSTVLQSATAAPVADFASSRDSFCKDPYSFVCNDMPQVDEKISQRKTLREKALPRTFDKLGDKLTGVAKTTLNDAVSEAGSGGIRNFGLQKNDVPAFVTGVRTYLSELEQLFPVKKKEVEDAAAELRKLHLARIDSLTLPLETRSSMKAIVEKVRILTFDDIFTYFENQGINWARDVETVMPVLADLMSKCGGDFLADNASYKTIGLAKTLVDDKGKEHVVEVQDNIIVLCPGAILSLVNGQKPNTKGLNTSVAHEFGHAYDRKFFPRAYGTMQACFVNEFQRDPEMVWGQMRGTDALTAFSNNLGEFVADSSGAEVLARQLENSGLSGTLAGLDALRQGLIGYCNEKASKKHPSGKFRIGTGYGANPVLRKVMGCKPQKHEPVTCTIDGRFPPG